MSGNFFDSNVLLYLLGSDERKRAISKRLLDEQGTISAQVLNEVSSVAKRKNALTWDEIDRFIGRVLPLVDVVPLTLATNANARSLAGRYGLSFYDALIVASAIGANCETLLTEDMHHGLRVGELTIVNPFR